MLSAPQMPTVDQAKAVTEELRARSQVPDHVFKVRRRRGAAGVGAKPDRSSARRPVRACCKARPDAPASSLHLLLILNALTADDAKQTMRELHPRTHPITQPCGLATSAGAPDAPPTRNTADDAGAAP